MISELNNFVRNHCAPLHSIAKAALATWMKAEWPMFPAIRNFHGQVLRIHPRFLTQDLNSVEPEVFAWMSQFLQSGSTALDVGANVGFHTMYMAKLVGNSGSIFAFEPAPANIEVLRYHTKVNQAKQVQIVDKAVSDQNSGTVPFFLLNGGNHSSNSLVFGREEIPNLDKTLHESARIHNVEVISIDQFCADTKLSPNLIKIDVEGAELQVLKGSTETLCSARPSIILAVHPWWLPPGQTTEDLVRFLNDQAYVIRDRFGNKVAGLGYGEYLCEPLTRCVPTPVSDPIITN